MPSPSSPYNAEIKLRHASVLSAAWVGYRLAWKGIVGLNNSLLSDHPYKEWLPWYYDPANPHDPAAGHAGEMRWDLWLVNVVGLLSVEGTVLDGDDAFLVEERRQALLSFFQLPALQVTIPDGTVYPVKMFNLELFLIEPYDRAHADGSDTPSNADGAGRCGGWVAHVELVHTPV